MAAVSFALFFLAIAWFASLHGWKGAVILWGASFFSLFVAAVLDSEYVLFQILLTCAATLIWLLFGSRPIVLRVLAVAALAVSYTWLTLGRQERHADLAQGRMTYPVLSVADRLTYETNQLQASEDNAKGKLVLSSYVRRQLDQQESAQAKWRMRVEKLRLLHSQQADEFANRAGFGAYRMLVRPTPYGLELPELASVSLPKYDPLPMEDAAAGSPGDSFEASRELPSGPSFAAVSELHERGLKQFFDPDRIGYVESRDHVVGFEPHAFQYIPEMSHPCGSSPSWVIARLELISLLKHDEPRVYMSEHLPRMDELKDAPTRALDAFEAGALPKLTTEEDVVIDEGINRVHMLGALRANKTCVQCHQVERGALLGAFSYELRRSQPVGQPEPNADPQPAAVADVEL